MIQRASPIVAICAGTCYRPSNKSVKQVSYQWLRHNGHWVNVGGGGGVVGLWGCGLGCPTQQWPLHTLWLCGTHRATRTMTGASFTYDLASIRLDKSYFKTTLNKKNINDRCTILVENYTIPSAAAGPSMRCHENDRLVQARSNKSFSSFCIPPRTGKAMLNVISFHNFCSHASKCFSKVFPWE